jgi:hypothetical protein
MLQQLTLLRPPRAATDQAGKSVEYKSTIHWHERCFRTGCWKPGLHVAPATQFHTVAPNFCGFFSDGTRHRHPPGFRNFEIAARFLEILHQCILIRDLDLYFTLRPLSVKVVYCPVTITLFYTNWEVGIKLLLTPIFRLFMLFAERCEVDWTGLRYYPAASYIRMLCRPAI